MTLVDAPPVEGARPHLHLRPRSLPSQRAWTTGSWDEDALAGTDVRLRTLPDDHRSFSSFRAILEQLEAFATPEERATTARLRQYMRDACPEEEDPSAHGRMLADSVSFAIMRRVSRESVYTARLIDLGARTLNRVLARIGAGGRVHVLAVDRLDRSTIKVLARAMLLLEPTQRFTWEWHSNFDPLGETTLPGHPPLYHASRRNLLRQLVAMLQPTMVRLPNSGDLCTPSVRDPASLFEISAALVVQNYDACLLLCDALERHGTAVEIGEALRLQGLAALNVGEVEAAVDSLERSEALAQNGGRRAHLAYLQGLIAAKRSYDLRSSRSHYERGLAATQGAPVGDDDLALERAWLLNGLALNAAILWRRDQQHSARFDEAFSLVRQAFDLVREGPTPARMYLRFNLIANSAFLLEMRGEYQHALNIFGKAFELDVPGAPVQEHRWRSNINYRIGALHRRAGDLDAARTCLEEAAEQDLGTDTWATHERILRALGVVHLQRGAHQEAADAFAAGLAACRAARSREGTLAHARGFVAALGRAGRETEARALVEELLVEEGLTFDTGPDTDPVHGSRGARLSPKLPAYIPEIDLEGIPAIDLNQFLGHPQPQPAGVHGEP